MTRDPKEYPYDMMIPATGPDDVSMKSRNGDVTHLDALLSEIRERVVWAEPHAVEIPCATVTALVEIVERMFHDMIEARRTCLCTRATKGFDYREEHPLKGHAGTGKRWLTPTDLLEETQVAVESIAAKLTSNASGTKERT